MGKQITLCKFPAHEGIQGNEEADKAAKQATVGHGRPWQDYLTWGGQGTLSGISNGKTVPANYTKIKPNIKELGKRPQEL